MMTASARQPLTSVVRVPTPPLSSPITLSMKTCPANGMLRLRRACIAKIAAVRPASYHKLPSHVASRAPVPLQGGNFQSPSFPTGTNQYHRSGLRNGHHQSPANFRRRSGVRRMRCRRRRTQDDAQARQLRAKNLYSAAKATQLFGNEVLRLLLLAGQGRNSTSRCRNVVIGSRNRFRRTDLRERSTSLL